MAIGCMRKPMNFKQPANNGRKPETQHIFLN
ncbi:Uncharacterised protein [uncultured archaeon]|nr:Uncharacterised protein [uncultured archaeon]